MDIFTKEKRSRNMAAIKNKNTKPEILLRKWLFSLGYRFRINVNYIPGHPDIFCVNITLLFLYMVTFGPAQKL